MNRPPLDERRSQGTPPTYELFAAWVARTPGAVAVVHGASSLTYAELATRASRLAALLVAEGARPGDRIALALERSFEHDRRRPGDPRSGLRVHAARDDLPARATRVHAPRRDAAPPHHADEPARSAPCSPRGVQSCARQRQRRTDRQVPCAAGAREGRPRRRRVRHVHVGLDRDAQRGRGGPPRDRAPGDRPRLRATRC